MGVDWTREEVEATVADYLAMLEAELAGVPFNKTAHRKGLSRLLHGRSDPAIERKHQNISAILIALGLPYINGYKPLGNYQQLLYDVVSDRVEGNLSLLNVVAATVARPADIPSVDDILAAFVESPKPSGARQYDARIREVPRARITNYLEIEAHNRSLGRAGEEFVVRFETARLIAERAERLAAKVEHVAVTRGDGLGYDVLSFDRDGRERLIEVKTTSYGKETPFFLSLNELAVSREEADKYHLYRCFGFRTKPKLFAKQGQLDRAFVLNPVTWMARS